MIVVDVNVLIAAYLEGHPAHADAAPWLAAASADATDPVVVPDLVWVAFVRIATNPRIVGAAANLADALGFVADITAAPGYRRHPGLLSGIGPFTRLCHDSNATAGLVTDAYIAAVALSLACPVATFDRDFHRFDGLALVTPTR